MSEVFSTILDPVGFGFGKAIFGADSAIFNVSDAFKTPKAPDGTGSTGTNKANEPIKPNMDTAAQDAQDEIAKSRRALLASGGETTLTGIGGAPLLGSQTTHKALLGG